LRQLFTLGLAVIVPYLHHPALGATIALNTAHCAEPLAAVNILAPLALDEVGHLSPVPFNYAQGHGGHVQSLVPYAGIGLVLDSVLKFAKLKTKHGKTETKVFVPCGVFVPGMAEAVSQHGNGDIFHLS
jgi:hypothetical protein